MVKLSKQKTQNVEYDEEGNPIIPERMELSTILSPTKEARVMITYYNTDTYISDIFLKTEDQELKLEAVNIKLPTEAKFLCLKSFQGKQYQPNVYSVDVSLPSLYAVDVTFKTTTTHGTDSSYEYFSETAASIDAGEERPTYFLFDLRFKSRFDYRDFKDPPFSPVEDPLCQLLIYFFHIIESSEFDNLAEQLFDDFEDIFLPLIYKSDSNFTRKTFRVIKSSLVTYQKHSRRVLSLLKFINVDTLNPIDKVLDEQIRTIYNQLMEDLKEVSINGKFKAFSNKGLNTCYREGCTRLFAFLMLNIPDLFLQIPKETWQEHSQEATSLILKLTKPVLKKESQDQIIDRLLAASLLWEKDATKLLKATLFKFMARQTDSFNGLLQLSKAFTEDAIMNTFNSPELVENVAKKLLNDCHNDAVKALELLNNSRALIPKESYIYIAKQLLLSADSLESVEILLPAIVAQIEREEELKSLIHACGKLVVRLMEQKTLSDLLQTVLKLKVLKEHVGQTLSNVLLEKMNLESISELRKSSGQILPILIAFPALIQPFFYFTLRKAKKGTDIPELILLVGSYHQLIAEDNKFWTRGVSIELFEPMVGKIIDLSDTIEETIANFDNLLTQFLKLGKDGFHLCTYFWTLFEARYSTDTLFQVLKHVESVETAKIKEAYTLFIINEKIPKISPQDISKIFSELFGKNTFPIVLKSTFSDEIVTKLIEKVDVPADFYLILPNLSENHFLVRIFNIENGTQFQQTEKYVQFSNLIKVFVEALSKLSITFEQAKFITQLSDDLFKVIQERLFLRVAPGVDCFSSFLKAKEIYTKATDLGVKVSNLFKKYLAKASDFPKDLQVELENYERSLPQTLIKDYTEPLSFALFRDIVGDVYQLTPSYNFNKFYDELLSTHKGPLQVSIIMKSLQGAIARINNIKKQLEGPVPPTVSEIEKLFIEIRTNEMINEEIELLARFLDLKEATVEHLKFIVEITMEKIEFLRTVRLFHDLANSFSFEQDATLKSLLESADALKNSDVLSDELGKKLQKAKQLAGGFFDDKTLLAFLETFLDSGELRKFVLEKNENDIKAMIEMLDDFGSSTIKTTEVAYLLDILAIFKWLKAFNPKGIIQCLGDIQSELKKFAGITEKIKICNFHLATFIQLTNKGEASRAIVRELVQNGVVRIVLQNSQYTAKIKSSVREKEIDIVDAIEMRDRLLLTLKSGEMNVFTKEMPQSQNEDLERYKIFIEAVESIEAIVLAIGSLYRKGSPEVEEKYEFEFNIKLLRTKREEFEKRKQGWDVSLELAFTNFYSLTFLHGRQFIKLADALSNYSTKFNRDTAYILQYVFGSYFEKLSFDDYKASIGKRSLDMLGEYLETKRNSLKQQQSENFQMTAAKYFVKTKADGMIKSACTVALNKFGVLPTATDCLVCTKDTSKEEAQAFLKRFIHCPTTKLFIVMKVEDLGIEMQEILIKMLLSYIERYDSTGKINAQIVFLLRDEASSIDKELQTICSEQFHIRHYEENVLAKYFQELPHRVGVVTSAEAGYGKTEWIKQQKGKRIHFPISGTVDRNVIVERLVRLDITQNTILHIDIGNLAADGFREINEILFSVLILGGMTTFEYAFVVPKGCQIYVEIHQSAYASIPVLDFFKKSRNHIEKLPPYELLPEMQETNQMVFGFLSLYKDRKLAETELMNLAMGDIKLDVGVVRELLDFYFLSKIHRESANFYKIKNFLDMAASLFSRFKKSVFFLNELLADPEVKNIVCEAIINYSREYTVKSVEYTIASQREALEKASIIKKQDLKHFSNEEESKGEIGFHSMKHFSLIFNDSGCCIPVYSDANQIPKVIKDLLESQRCETEDFRKMEARVLIEKLFDFAELPPEKKELEEYYKLQAMESDYVLTADNFFKMCLLITKCRAQMPVIIMGEAGCGKTSLVKFLAENIMQVPFVKINFHAGMTSEKLYKELEEKVLGVAKEAQAEGSRVWLFLDEINTSETLGLVTEMMTFHTFNGEPLPENIQYIAAVNPYVKRAGRVEVGLVRKEEHQKTQELAYTVYPLPESLFNFVWNFDQLNKNDEVLYIQRMLRCKSDDEILNLGVHCIMRSHEFIRDKEGLGSVSLRDVKRFVIVFEWFWKSLNARWKIAQLKKQQQQHQGITSWLVGRFGRKYDLGEDWNENKIRMRAVLLSLVICYYIRLEKQTDRMRYLRAISEITKKGKGLGKDFESEEGLLKVIEDEQTEYLNRMRDNTDKNLLRGVAFNTALRENVFAMLVCLVNKIPVIVCGRPGCSKTLSFQLLLNNLRGSESKDDFFKTLPTLIPVTFQGSLISTSEGILRVFEKAQRILDDNYDVIDRTNTREIISVVFFDEMGLAELSKNNPLKVLHSLLEYEADYTPEQLKKRVAFVGISNWKLDVSKMSRAVFLARPDLDVPELKYTAKSIMDSFESNLTGLERYLEALSEAYSAFRGDQQGVEEIYKNFHGLRDFYSLIKEACKFYTKNNNKMGHLDLVDKTITYAIERNFGGAAGAAERLKAHFRKKINIQSLRLMPIPVLGLIQLNFSDAESRYLMLITKGNFGPQLVANYLSNLKKKFTMMVGSQFEQDIGQGEYSARMLSSIITCLEDGTSLIMQGLDNIYPSLYDLFNQNFTIISKKKTCKIALGKTNNSTCTVHDDFRCIILIDEKQLPEQDPPFLNRFEKQTIGWENIITNVDAIAMVDRVRSWLKDLCSSAVNEKKFVLPQHWLILNSSDENIASLIMEHWKPPIDEEKIFERIKSDILLTASADIIPACYLSKAAQQKSEILRLYYGQPHSSLSSYLQTAAVESKGVGILKSIVYTYSTSLEALELSELKYDAFLFASMHSEKELDIELKRFMNGDKTHLVLRLKAESDEKHFNLIKFLVERMAAQSEDKLPSQKHVVIVFHLERQLAFTQSQAKTLSMTYISGWKQIMIDSLSGKQYLDFQSLLHLSSEEILQENKVIRFDEDFEGMVTEAYLKINFADSRSEKVDMNAYVANVANFLAKNEKVRALFLEKIYQMTSIDKKWLVEIVYDKHLLSNTRNIYDAVKKYFANVLERQLLQIIITLESSGGMCSLLNLADTFSKEDAQTRLLFEIWTKIFREKDCKREVIHINKQNVLLKPWSTKVPFSFESLSACYNNLQLTNYVKQYKSISLSGFNHVAVNFEEQNQKEKLLASAEKLIEDLPIMKLREKYDPNSFEYQTLQSLLIKDAQIFFVTEYLKRKEKYSQLLEIALKDTLSQESEEGGSQLCISEVILALLSYQRAFSSLLAIAKSLKEIYPKKQAIATIIRNYEALKASPPEFPAIERMYRAITQGFYPSLAIRNTFSSWEKLLGVISEVVLHGERIQDEISLRNEFMGELILWRDILSSYKLVGSSMEAGIDNLVQKMESAGEISLLSGFQADVFVAYCKIYEDLYKELLAKRSTENMGEKPIDTNVLIGEILRNFGDGLYIFYVHYGTEWSKNQVLEHSLTYDYLRPYLAKMLKLVVQNLKLQVDEFDPSSLVASDNTVKLLDKKLNHLDTNHDFVVQLEYFIYNFKISSFFEHYEKPFTAAYILGLWEAVTNTTKKQLVNIQLICALGALKYLVKCYCSHLFETNNQEGRILGQNEDKFSKEAQDAVEKILTNKKHPLTHSLRIYALRVLSSLYESLEATVDHNQSKVEWISELKLLEGQEERKEADGLPYAAIIKGAVDIENLKDIPYIKLMRITNAIPPTNFKQAYSNANVDTIFPLINVFFKLEEHLQGGSTLWQIISFTNYLFRQVNQRMSHEEALSMTIGEFLKQQPESVRTQFEDFQKAWSTITELTYNSKELPDKAYNEDLPLIFLLPNNSIKEGGHYITAAFQQLSEDQNSILEQIKSSPKILARYPHLKDFLFTETYIQDALEEEIITDTSKEIQQVIASTTYPSSSFGKGNDLVYDFKAVEDAVFRYLLLTKKKLDAQRIRMVQFKGELAKDENTDIVRMMRKKISQQSLTPQDARAFKQYLDEKKLNDQCIEDLYVTIAKILAYASKSRLSGENIIGVSKNVRGLNLPYSLEKELPVDLRNLDLKYIVHLYEILEEEYYYPIAERKAQEWFKVELETTQNQQVEKVLRKMEEKGIALDILVKGLKRFVTRYLDDDFKRKAGLKNCLGSREGLWPMERLAVVIELINEHFPEEIKVENIISVIRRIQEYISLKEVKMSQIKKPELLGDAAGGKSVIMTVVPGRTFMNVPKKAN